MALRSQFADKVVARLDVPKTNLEFLRVHFGELSLVERYKDIDGCTPFWEDSAQLPLELFRTHSGKPDFFFPAGIESGPSFYAHWTQRWWLVCELRQDVHMGELVCNCGLLV